MGRLRNILNSDFSFLRGADGFEVVSDEDFPKHFGNEILIAKAGNLLFRFVWDRGDFRVDVKANQTRDDWDTLAFALAAARGDDQVDQTATVPVTQARLLEQNLAALNDAFSDKHLATTKSHLEFLSAAAREAWVARFNAKR